MAMWTVHDITITRSYRANRPKIPATSRALDFAVDACFGNGVHGFAARLFIPKLDSGKAVAIRLCLRGGIHATSITGAGSGRAKDAALRCANQLGSEIKVIAGGEMILHPVQNAEGLAFPFGFEGMQMAEHGVLRPGRRDQRRGA